MKAQTSKLDIIRTYFSAYEQKDKEMLIPLLSDALVFTSPHDPHLDITAYFEQCWPNSKNIRAYDIKNLVEDDNEVIIRYEAESMNGAKFLNVEYFKFSEDKIAKIEVYYGSLPS